MTAVAHASPGELGRLVTVRTGPVVRSRPSCRRAATYRRRRVAALLVVASGLAALILVVHGLLASFGGGPLSASERPGAPAAVYVVQPGDTFWGIASRMRAGEDPRPLVAQLVSAHGSPVLVAGERLVLPAPA
ncbi:MAG TPA: LysM peptidoglycan-binding domain-containing protein [Acidimicrobiales bacterium]|nr:LysM peptidoglycan-binding domain-containing protein [Acidimicrobiales bacterium]